MYSTILSHYDVTEKRRRVDGTGTSSLAAYYMLLSAVKFLHKLDQTAAKINIYIHNSIICDTIRPGKDEELLINFEGSGCNNKFEAATFRFFM